MSEVDLNIKNISSTDLLLNVGSFPLHEVIDCSNLFINILAIVGASGAMGSP